MDDLISRQSAVNMIKRFIAVASSYGITPRLAPYYIMNGIENLPSAEKTEKTETFIELADGTRYIPESVIDDIRAEIEHLSEYGRMGTSKFVLDTDVLAIINKHIKAVEE